jgi:hypothetical protein
MAYITLAEPGTKHGPCAEECEHVDCNETKRKASTLCPYCLKPLGYGQALTRADTTVSTGLGHFSCIEEQIEKEMAAAK